MRTVKQNQIFFFFKLNEKIIFVSRETYQAPLVHTQRALPNMIGRLVKRPNRIHQISANLCKFYRFPAQCLLDQIQTPFCL